MAKEKVKKNTNLLSIAQKVVQATAGSKMEGKSDLLSLAQDVVQAVVKDKSNLLSAAQSVAQTMTENRRKEHSVPIAAVQPRSNVAPKQHAKAMPKLLIISDEDYVDGYHKGHYPEVTKLMRERERDRMLMTRSEAEKHWGDDVLAVPPRLDEHECYQLNPYDQRYYLIGSSELETSLVSAKEVVYAHILQKLGAKRVQLVRNVEEEEKTNKELDVKGQATIPVAGGKGSFHADENRRAKTSVHTAMAFEDPSNSPQSPEQVREYMSKYGLDNDLTLKLWVETLGTQKRLSGKHRYTATFLSEMDSAQKMVGELSGGWKVFSASLSTEYKKNSSRTYKIEQVLEVEF